MPYSKPGIQRTRLPKPVKHVKSALEHVHARALQENTPVPQGRPAVTERFRSIMGSGIQTEVQHAKGTTLVRTYEDRTSEVFAYGTSEGVKKEWDERGRGEHSEPPKYKPPKGPRMTRPGANRDYKSHGNKVTYNLKWHFDRMTQLMKEGLTKDEASSQAMREMKITPRTL